MITKTRQSDPIHIASTVQTGTKVGSGGSDCISRGSAAASYIPLEESITYEVGRGMYNYCDHVLIQRDAQTGGIYGGWQPSFPSYSTYCKYTANSHVSGTSAIDAQMQTAGIGDVDVSADDINELIPLSIQGMWPEVENRLGESLINGLKDLPDLRRLPSLIPRLKALRGNPNGLARLARETGSSVTRLRLSHGSKGLISWLKNANLSYQFGIRPLVQDSVAIAATIEAASAEAERLYANANKIRTSHFRVPLFSRYPDTDVSLPNGSYGGESLVTYQGKRHMQKAWFTATMVYSYTLPDFSRSIRTLRAFADSVGFNLNPRVVWDATRLSFIVDWFLKVGNFLDQFKMRALEPKVVIHTYGYSTLLDYVQDVWKTTTGFGLSDRYRFVWRRRKSYQRRRVRPSFTTALQQGPGLSLNKAGILFSLRR